MCGTALQVRLEIVEQLTLNGRIMKIQLILFQAAANHLIKLQPVVTCKADNSLSDTYDYTLHAYNDTLQEKRWENSGIVACIG